MEIRDKKNRTAEIEPNSKPLFVKRIGCFFVDLGILFLTFFLGYLGIMKTPLANNYHHFQTLVMEVQDKIKLETGYGERTYCEKDKDYSDYNIYMDEEHKKYIVTDVENPSEEIKHAYYVAIKESEDYSNYTFSMELHNYVICLGIFGVSEAIFFIAIPLFNKKKATLGMMAFKISLYSTRKDKYAEWHHVLLRFLFIFFIESAIPFMWLNLYTFLIIPVASFIFVILNKNNRSLRDFLSCTMLIEDASYDPIIPLD